MKRHIAAICLAGLLLAGGLPAYADSVRVGDYQVQPAVDLLRRHGIVSGDPGGNMRLGDTITRAELAKIVVVAMGQGAAAEKAQSEAPAFSDVKGHWAQGYIAVARRLGIAGGYGDATFRPGSPVTNAEAVTMLLRAGGLRPSGPWPEAYLNAARQTGVLPDSLRAHLPQGAVATRAAVFLLAERSFTLIPDSQGASLLQRSFGKAAPGVAVTAQGVEGGVTLLSSTTLMITAPQAVLLQVNGQPAWAQPGGPFAFRTELKPGLNEFFIFAVDELGNRGQQRFLVERR